ncbi:MAG TPA: metallophosphoesterase [Saccharofermentans sp.]|nr:metallophosphoesterase [Saccharofermentans sp.]
MKILCLSDLHRSATKKSNRWQDKEIAKLLDTLKPELIVCSGDIHESNVLSPYKDLAELFQGIPAVCTLGNHEFYNRTYEETIGFYIRKYQPDKYHVHYLDIVGRVEFGDMVFFGNALFFDGSLLKHNPGQKVEDFADGTWSDKLIKGFGKDWKTYHELCALKIKNEYAGYTAKMTKSERQKKELVLVTHHVPCAELNVWPFQHNPYTVYSGCENFLKGFDFDWVICGHTHNRTVGQNVSGKKNCFSGGINVGSDYGILQHYLLQSTPLSYVSIEDTDDFLFVPSYLSTDTGEWVEIKVNRNHAN